MNVNFLPWRARQQRRRQRRRLLFGIVLLSLVIALELRSLLTLTQTARRARLLAEHQQRFARVLQQINRQQQAKRAQLQHHKLRQARRQAARTVAERQFNLLRQLPAWLPDTAVLQTVELDEQTLTLTGQACEYQSIKRLIDRLNAAALFRRVRPVLLQPAATGWTFSLTLELNATEGKRP